jgi:hypothetical protein
MEHIKFNQWLWARLNQIEHFPCTEKDVDDYIKELCVYLTQDGVHYGDCVNQNVTCKLCELEYYLTKYKQEICK